MPRIRPDLHPRLRRRSVPTWWRDAKFGIFIHWTPASVPAFAPVDSEIGPLMAAGRPDALAHSPYTEWYENSLRFPDSPVARWHRSHYGNRPYADFVDDWESALESWDPQDWAARFAAAGARYVVLVSKHHDGWCLWPTEVPNPRRPGWHCRRDVVGELGEAVRAEGMRYGLYYSGGLDWTFDERPLSTFADMMASVPGGDYPAYAEAHVGELVRRYRPDVLWNDIVWPGGLGHLRRVLHRYYEAVPDGVINDRWMPTNAAWRVLDTRVGRQVADWGAARSARTEKGIVPPRPPHFDVRTPEYTVFDTIRREPWECVRGIDHSFGYNRTSTDQHHLGRAELLTLLADIASKGGNLLLNVGPRGEDAQIPELQRQRLDWLAEWRAGNGEGLADTRPWIRWGGDLPEGGQVRFVARGRDVIAACTPDGEGLLAESVTIPGVRTTATTRVGRADGSERAWRVMDGMVVVDLPTEDRQGVLITLGDVVAMEDRGSA